MKRMKYLGINLRENDCTHKTVRNWWKKLNTLQTNGKLHPAHGLGKLILLKWPYYPRHIQIQCTFSLVVKIPIAFFTELEQIVPKFAWKKQRPWISKAIVRERNRAGYITFPELKLYYKTIVIKSHVIWQLTYYEGGKKIQWETAFLRNGAGKHWTGTHKIIKLENFLTPHV